MANILIVYATDYGNTKKVAETVADGARKIPKTSVVIKQAEEVTQDDVLQCDGLIVGSPVHMGSPDWRVKKFIDTVCSKLWMKDLMIGKVGAVFACGGGFGSAGGGCEITMLALLNNLFELGLIIIPLPKNTAGYHAGGLQMGPYSRSMGEHMEQTGVTQEKMEAAHHHGMHVARAAALLKGNTIFQAADLAARMKS